MVHTFKNIVDDINKNGNGMLVSFSDLDINPETLATKGVKLGMKDILSAYKHRAKFNASKGINPIAPGLADIVNWIIYDRNSFAQATSVPTNFKFFTQPIGTASKTKADTNLDQVQRLPDPLWMNVLGIGFHWAPNVYPGDIITFLNTYYQEFWVGQKTYVEGPFQCFPSACGVLNSANMSTAALALTFANGFPSAMSTNGVPRTDNMFDLRLPAGIHLGYESDGAGNRNAVISDGLTGITILQGQNFRVECNAPGGGFTLTATALGGFGLNLMCYLFGILSRGVQ